MTRQRIHLDYEKKVATCTNAYIIYAHAHYKLVQYVTRVSKLDIVLYAAPICDFAFRKKYRGVATRKSFPAHLNSWGYNFAVDNKTKPESQYKVKFKRKQKEKK
ncbi:hypothetical protein EYC80_005926 [Monilinia laxa]|uniref:Uncharacterized protein n=1 Tax=Monilinia laxa TaxID=61186 RepID=A0A5N6KFR9_MONLA|nr:hypothetical protein EYC80_005926 [Monilinia laxa]